MCAQVTTRYLSLSLSIYYKTLAQVLSLQAFIENFFEALQIAMFRARGRMAVGVGSV
jgi:hypothetical protein